MSGIKNSDDAKSSGAPYHNFRFHFQTANAGISPHSRDTICPSFASGFAPSDRRGRRETGCTLHPQPRTQRKRTSARDYRYRRCNRPSLRNGFNGCSALSPVIGLFCHRRLQLRDYSLSQAQRPFQGARTTRLGRPRAIAANDLLGTSYQPSKVVDDSLVTPVVRALVMFAQSETQP